MSLLNLIAGSTEAREALNALNLTPHEYREAMDLIRKHGRKPSAKCGKTRTRTTKVFSGQDGFIKGSGLTMHKGDDLYRPKGKASPCISIKK